MYSHTQKRPPTLIDNVIIYENVSGWYMTVLRKLCNITYIMKAHAFLEDIT